jgi:hypothetical protein
LSRGCIGRCAPSSIDGDREQDIGLGQEWFGVAERAGGKPASIPANSDAFGSEGATENVWNEQDGTAGLEQDLRRKRVVERWSVE